MSPRQKLEERLREAGIPLDSLSSIPGIAPTIVLTVSYTTSGDIAVTHTPPCDTAVYFEGFYYPLPGATLLIEHAVAVDLGLAVRPE